MYMPSFMKIDVAVQAILWFCFCSLNGYNVGIIEGNKLLKVHS
jgi:hypothetical protein